MKKEVRFQTIFLFGMLLFILVSTAGCSSAEFSQESMGTAKRKERQEYNLITNPWEDTAKVTESRESWIYTEYWEYLESSVSNMYVRGRLHAENGTHYYILERYTNGEVGPSCQKYCLTCLDTLTLQTETVEWNFSPVPKLNQEENQNADLRQRENANQEQLQELTLALQKDLDENWLVITGMDIQDGKLWLLAVQMDRETKSYAHYYAMCIDAWGNIESAVDLLPEVEQAGMLYKGTLPDGMLSGGDYLYIGIADSNLYNSEIKTGIFDLDGNFLKFVEPPDGSENPVICTGRLPDGWPIFEYKDSASKETVIFCMEEGEGKVLYRGERTSAWLRYLNAYGEIFSMEDGRLLRWDGATGECEALYQDDSLASLQCEAIVENSAEEMVLLFYDYMEDYTFALRLQLKEKEPETMVTIYQLYDYWQLESYAKEYCRRNPGVKIELLSPEKDEDSEIALAKLMTLLSQESGPDMFMLRTDQMSLLQEKGILDDLTDIFPQKLKEQIFPGVLQCAEIDGRLYGVIDHSSVSTVMVKEDIWPEDTWTYQDIMKLMKEKGFTSVFGSQSAGSLLYSMIFNDIGTENSSLIDWEQKQCSFASDDFVELLKFCKEYGSVTGSGTAEEEKIADMQSGRQLAYQFSGNLRGFNMTMAALGDGYQCIGFPTEGEYGSCLSCSSSCCVNAQSENKEIAYDFLQFLLSSRMQKKMGIESVRRDILTDNVADGISAEEGPFFRANGNSIIPLDGRRDGSSFLPEYLDIMEKGANQPMWSTSETLGYMIMEEAEAYFCGDKTPEEAAKVIQSRAWVYLNE